MTVTKNPLMPSPLPRPRSADELIRIRDLSQIADQDVSLSMDFAVDTPNETFKTTWLQLVNYIKSEVINSSIGVGAIYLTANKDDTPQSRGYTGTWEEIEPETSINMVNTGDLSIGSITGDNEKPIPLLKHAHTNSASSSSSFSGAALPPHKHTYKQGRYTGDSYWNNPNNGQIDGNYTTDTSSVSAGTPSGSVTTSTSVSINDSGEVSPTINIQNKSINVIGFIKVSL